MTRGEAPTGRRRVVHGRVQGVSFRWFTQRAAIQIGVRGWVRNRSDGTVEAEAWGSGDQRSEGEERLHEGSPLSRVDRLQREELTTAPESSSAEFEIRTTI